MQQDYADELILEAVTKAPHHVQVAVLELKLPTLEQLQAGEGTGVLSGEIVRVFRSREDRLRVGGSAEIRIPNLVPDDQPEFMMMGGFNVITESIVQARHLELVLDHRLEVDCGLVLAVPGATQEPCIDGPWLAPPMGAAMPCTGACSVG